MVAYLNVKLGKNAHGIGWPSKHAGLSLPPLTSQAGAATAGDHQKYWRLNYDCIIVSRLKNEPRNLSAMHLHYFRRVTVIVKFMPLVTQVAEIELGTL